MEIPEMVLCVLKTLAAGPTPSKRLVDLNWSAWDKAPTDKVRCVFHTLAYGDYACSVYPTRAEWSHGVDLCTRETWTVDD